MINTHTHSNFSSDARDSVEWLCTTAQRLNLKYLAVTDHYDPELNGAYAGVKDLNLYTKTVNEQKGKYGDLYVACGLEVGFVPELAEKTAGNIDKYNFEYIINSIHQVSWRDCYFSTFFENKTKQQAYIEYLLEVLKSLHAPYNYHAIGHFGYIMRNSVYQNKSMVTSETNAVIDEILNYIIKNDKIIELNTSTLNSGTKTLPEFDILKRYKQLGGKYITFASDAHWAQHLINGYNEAVKTAIDAGFDSFTVVKNGIKEKIDISVIDDR